MDNDAGPLKVSTSLPLSQLCYDIAYFILPHYAFKNLAKIEQLCEKSPESAGPFFYVMACQTRKIEPTIADAKRLKWHRGKFGGQRKFFCLEFPVPPTVDLSTLPPEQFAKRGEQTVVLAPYFAVIIGGPQADSASYFVLGQAPFGGGTTPRRVLPNGNNCNLGPGPRPELKLFLDTVEAATKLE